MSFVWDEVQLTGEELLAQWSQRFGKTASRIQHVLTLFRPLAEACVSGSCKMLDRIPVGHQRLRGSGQNRRL